MKTVIRLEELAMFLLSVWLFSGLPYPWWLYPALILLPDIGMFGYLFNNRIGAFTYNLLHHKGVALGVYLSGIFFASAWLQLAGIILFGHSSLDRSLGYGLKFSDSFKHTHLGTIGPDTPTL